MRTVRPSIFYSVLQFKRIWFHFFTIWSTWRMPAGKTYFLFIICALGSINDETQGENENTWHTVLFQIMWNFKNIVWDRSSSSISNAYSKPGKRVSFYINFFFRQSITSFWRSFICYLRNVKLMLYSMFNSFL